MLINKKINLLAIKIQSLQEELLASQDIVHHAASEVDKLFRERHPELFKSNTNSEGNISKQGQNTHKQENKAKQPIPPSKESKNVFRKIALKTHPDRLLDDPNVSEKEEKIKLYQKAVKAHEENDIIALHHIADKLGIKPPQVSEQDIKKAENAIVKLQNQIKGVEETVIWQWFIAEGKRKDNILERLMILMYEQSTKNDTSP
tara:strand:- start:2180 stop:2788 length:609 start_codon:yes stop_codon:yes gene_type:complete